MARPKKEGMDYFSHDTDAVNDEKIEALRMLYGNDGYAFYFILLERIYRTPEGELDVSDAETIQILSHKIAISVELFEKMLATCLKRGIFDKGLYEERGVLTSNGVKKRMAPVVEKRKKMRQDYVSKQDDNSGGVSDAETGQEVHKGKERIGENSIVEHSKLKDREEGRNAPAPSHPNAFARINQTYQQFISHRVGTNQNQLMGYWLDEYKNPDLICFAIEKAGEKEGNAKSKEGFVDWLVKHWQSARITTLEAARKYEVERNKKPQSKQAVDWDKIAQT